MQISAANLLVASQQAAKAAPRPGGAFATELAKEKPGFKPLAFKQVETPAQQASQARSLPMASAPLGSQVDIRV
jgi:hypothetical protein